jgi:hypothetical protein
MYLDFQYNARKLYTMVPKIICGGGSAKTYQNNLEPDLVLSFQSSLRWYYFQKILYRRKP